MRISIRNTTVLLVAIASLVPFTFETEQAGFFINYFYIALLFLPFMRYRYTETGTILILIYTFIFIAGIFKMLNNDLYYALRVTMSYVVFIFPFLLVFARIEDSYFQKFKDAVIFVSLLYALMMLYTLISIGYSGDFYATKDQMGSNRFGFVLIFAFFILLYEEKYRLLVKIIFLTILVVGLVLTFSRSSIVAFVVALGVMAFMNFRRINFKYIFGAGVFAIILAIVFRETIIGQIVDFFSKYLLSYKDYNLVSSKTSEGYRVYVLKQILTYVLNHPIFGSNYAGLYLLYDEYSVSGASSHNQYTDVLLRTGVVGLFFFMYALLKMTIFYFKNQSGIFYGLVGILVYGFFHETFKLAHGSFIFGMLFSYYLLKRETQSREMKARASSTTGPQQALS